MVEVKDIDSKESLQAWLSTRPPQISMEISFRAAMRVVPIYLRWYFSSQGEVKQKLSPLSILWPILLSEVIVFSPKLKPKSELHKRIEIDDSIVAAANSINMKSFKNADVAKIASGDALSALGTSSHAAYTAAGTPSFALDAALAVSYAARITTVIWNSTRSDMEALLDEYELYTRPILSTGSIPLAKEWADVKARLEKDGVDWSFWIRWYEAALNGKPLKRDMLERIALIPPEDWAQGPAHLNRLIARIEEGFEWEEPELGEPPVQALFRNQSVIEAQLDTLAQLVTQEMTRLRGQNDFTKAGGEVIAARVSVLEGILAAIDKIKAALAGGTPPNALAVIDEQLPIVSEGATKLAKTEEQPKISVSVAQMGETISFLTQRGTPGTLATGIAASEWAISQPMRWWKQFRNSKP